MDGCELNNPVSEGLGTQSHNLVEETKSQIHKGKLVLKSIIITVFNIRCWSKGRFG